MNDQNTNAEAAKVGSNDLLTQRFAYSIDGENYTDEYSTRERALAEAKATFPDEDCWWTGEIVPPPQPDEYWNVGGWLETVACQEEYSSEWAEPWVEDAFSSSTHHEELEAKVRPLLEAWIKKHGLTPSFFKIINDERHDQ